MSTDMFTFSISGDWKNAHRMVRLLPHDIERINKRTLGLVGLRAERIAVLHLQRQDLNWRRLDKRYLKQKVREGKSEKTLIATSQYFQSIKSRVVRDSALVGVFRGVRNKEGELIADIAKIMEFGSEKRNIPARPLWMPTLKETVKWMRQTNIFADELIKFARRKYGVK